jgi:outer membrane protein
MDRSISQATIVIPALLLVLFCGSVAYSAPAAQDSSWSHIGIVRGDTLYVSRDKVVAATLANNEMLAASGAMLDAASAEAQGAWRAFLPQVQLGEFFLRSDDALNSFGYKLQQRTVTASDFNPAMLNAPGETNHFVTRLQLLQPIYNGGSGLNGKRAANAMSRAAEHNHVRAGETVRFHAIQAFEGLALAKAYEGVIEAAVASAEGHVRQARSMMENEMATEADLLQAKVYLSGLQQQLIEVRNMMAIAGENIKLLTATMCPLPLAADTSMNHAFDGMSLQGLNASRILSRSDLLARKEEAAAAGNMVGVARGNLFPHLNLSLQQDYYSESDLFGNDAKSWTLGVYATWDIFKGMQNVSELKKAKAQSRAANYMVDFENRQARVQATQAWLEASAAHQKVEVAQGAVNAAREGLRIVTNQYREGLATMVNLLDTQAAGTMAEGNLVQAMHDYQVGLANLEFSGAGNTPANTAVTEPNTSFDE